MLLGNKKVLGRTSKLITSFYQAIEWNETRLAKKKSTWMWNGELAKDPRVVDHFENNNLIPNRYR